MMHSFIPVIGMGVCCDTTPGLCPTTLPSPNSLSSEVPFLPLFKTTDSENMNNSYIQQKLLHVRYFGQQYTAIDNTRLLNAANINLML